MKNTINYSGIFGLVLMAALFFLSVSCNKVTVKENPDADNSSQLIKISGEDAGTATKTTLELLATKWVMNTDFVGIYSPQARPTSEGSASVTNRKYIATTSASSSAFSPESGNEMYWGTGPHNFYAYYPYSVSAGSVATAVPISLPTAQTQSEGGNNAHIGALDFLVATPKTVVTPGTTGNPTTVDLRYNHVFTVLEFQIKGTGQLKAVKLSGSNALAFSGGTINITQTTPATGVAYTLAGLTGTTKEAVVTLTTPASLTTTNTDTKVYMVINPGTPTGSCLIGLSTDGTTWKYISKVAPVGGFKRGIKYVVSIDAATATLENVVVGGAGMIWMDRNLGATQVATSSTDAAAYGDLYQWGRGTDGHQIRTSSTTGTFSSLDVPGNANFILAPYTPFDWRSPQNDGLWQGVNGVNNPCPSGFRLPTETELNNERASWSSQNSAGAYASPLKFTVAGLRQTSYGITFDYGSNGYYWSSTIGGTSSYSLNFDSSSADMGSYYGRAVGCSVRCIKN